MAAGQLGGIPDRWPELEVGPVVGPEIEVALPDLGEFISMMERYGSVN